MNICTTYSGTLDFNNMMQDTSELRGLPTSFLIKQILAQAVKFLQIWKLRLQGLMWRGINRNI
jgi:hypothetical protein